jgi:hypothetical protein
MNTHLVPGVSKQRLANISGIHIVHTILPIVYTSDALGKITILAQPNIIFVMFKAIKVSSD